MAWRRRRRRTWSPRELLALIAGQPPLFEPGSSRAYSSTNYLLLGLVVERVTGNSYATEVERRILRPLDLRDTEVPGANPHIAGSHPHGYLRGGNREPVDITAFDHSFAGAAGEIVSSTTDLNRFYRALMTGRLLPAAQLTEMRTVRAADHGFDYGLGIASRQLPDGTTLWGHNGGTFGFETFSWTTGDGGRQVTVAVTPRPDGDLHARVNAFLTAAFRRPLPPTPPKQSTGRATATSRILHQSRAVPPQHPGYCTNLGPCHRNIPDTAPISGRATATSRILHQSRVVPPQQPG